MPLILEKQETCNRKSPVCFGETSSRDKIICKVEKGRNRVDEQVVSAQTWEGPLAQTNCSDGKAPSDGAQNDDFPTNREIVGALRAWCRKQERWRQARASASASRGQPPIPMAGIMLANVTLLYAQARQERSTARAQRRRKCKSL